MLQKEKLDQILKQHKAQPVDRGYIDIIVKRENVQQFVNELLDAGVVITRVTWWYYVSAVGKRSSYGFGGPTSKYYSGWFSELCFGDDDISLDMTLLDIMAIIENKEIVYENGRVLRFKRNKNLTPAFWLEVPERWENLLE